MSEREHHRDKVIADTGWGVKPDDQPANADDARGHAIDRFDYRPGDPHAVRRIVQLQRRGFNTANRIVIQRGLTRICDINGDVFEIVGLSYGDENLIELCKVLGAAFNPQQLRDLGADYDGVREYPLSRAWAWGAERTG